MRSAYDLDPPRADWSQALCQAHPDLWFQATWEGKARAAHWCTHCPVLTLCTAELARTPPSLRSQAVIAGVPHSDKGEPAKWPLPRVGCHLCWQQPQTTSLETRLRTAGK